MKKNFKYLSPLLTALWYYLPTWHYAISGSPGFLPPSPHLKYMRSLTDELESVAFLFPDMCCWFIILTVSMWIMFFMCRHAQYWWIHSDIFQPWTAPQLICLLQEANLLWDQEHIPHCFDCFPYLLDQVKSRRWKNNASNQIKLLLSFPHLYTQMYLCHL